MLPFFYTSYKKAPLATCVSFIASMFILLAVLFSVGFLLNWQDLRQELSLGTSLLAAAAFGALGFGLRQLAKRLAERKYQKLSAKETVPKPAQSATPVGKPSVGVKTGFCPKCGAKTELGDVFCIHCGVKL
ncbi:MAG: zinc ribbon domain-containing protein [Clostridia bacterium]|nr:zinc ribbon domain-containing protein [Clostridia bacterium]